MKSPFQILIFIISFVISLALISCKSNPKLEKIDTRLNESQSAGGNLTVGINNDDRLIYQKKKDIVSEMIQLEDEVRQLSDKLYGSPDYGSKGLYGQAIECRKKRAQKTGTFIDMPNKSPVLEADQVKVGQEEHSKKLISLTEENLLVRLERFKEYKKTLYARQEELERYIEQCEVGSK